MDQRDATNDTSSGLGVPGARGRTTLVHLGGHPLFRDALRAAFRRFGVNLVEAGSLPATLDAVDREGVRGVVVDDDGMGAAGVLEAVNAVVARAPDVKVAVLSASRSPTLPADAIGAGAAAFLSKDMPLDELRYAIERMLRGQLVVDPAATRSLLGLSSPGGNGRSAGRGLHLSPVERRVLSLVSVGKANKQIGTELKLSPLTVKNHVARIRARLGAADKAHAVALALRSGLLD